MFFLLDFSVALPDNPAVLVRAVTDHRAVPVSTLSAANLGGEDGNVAVLALEPTLFLHVLNPVEDFRLDDVFVGVVLQGEYFAPPFRL